MFSPSMKRRSRDLAGGRDQATVLRRFEVRLLAAMGYALPLVREADTGAPVDPPPATITRSTAGRDATPPVPGRDLPVVRGTTLLALAEQRYPDAATAAEAKRLMREVLDHYLEQRGVESRRVVQDLQALEDETGTRP